MNHPLRILLVDDDWSVRQAVRDFLVRHEMIVVEADCFETALAAAIDTKPDVAVIDIVLPRCAGGRANFDQHTGIEAARVLRQELPQLGIVFLSAYVDRGPEVLQLFMEGHERIVYLLKGSKPQELLDAIGKVARNLATLEIGPGVRVRRNSVPDQVLGTLTAEEQMLVQFALERLPMLTKPEARVFRAIGSCQTHKHAAEQLGVSVKTISSHIDNIYDKLGLREIPAGLSQLMLVAKIHLVDQLRRADSP